MSSAAATTTHLPPATGAEAGTTALSAMAATASAASSEPKNGGSGAKTVTVSADLLDRIIKNVGIVCEMVRRDAERAKMCGGCEGESDYLAEYKGEYIPSAKAYVCERCMENTVSRKHGMDVYVWKHDLARLTCRRCGDDVTARGWCVCPRNAALARGDAAPAARPAATTEAGA